MTSQNRFELELQIDKLERVAMIKRCGIFIVIYCCLGWRYSNLRYFLLYNTSE